jgi:hypothetical protein
MRTRESILSEIGRTAKESGPLGVRRFEAETGINSYEWGRYWARWGDALREAGFEPNEFQAGYTEDVLIGNLIRLIRELGKFPTMRELEVKQHEDTKFPSKKVFQHLGAKGQLATKVLAYCKDRIGYDDVMRLCAPHVIRTQLQLESRKSEPDEGYVYLIKSGRYYKIGKTNATGRREYELAIQLPQKPKTIHVIKTDDPAGIEAYWHKRFDNKRQGGEWFDLNVDEIRAFKRRKFM